MAQRTELSVAALPGAVHTFTPKPHVGRGVIGGSGASLAGRAAAFDSQPTSADALRLYLVGIEIMHLLAVGTVPGVRILLAAARNGTGAGLLRYLAGALYWRAPGSATFGAAVPAAVDGEYHVADERTFTSSSARKSTPTMLRSPTRAYSSATGTKTRSGTTT